MSIWTSIAGFLDIFNSKLRNSLQIMNVSWLMAITGSQYTVAQAGLRDTPVDREGWRQFSEEMREAKLKRLDETFKVGEQIYKGNKGYRKLNYCVVDFKTLITEELSQPISREQLGDLLVPLTKDSVRPLQGISVSEFANELYDCDEIGAKVLNKIEKREAGLVIYYLNAEFNLNLKQKKGGGEKAKRPTE